MKTLGALALSFALIGLVGCPAPTKPTTGSEVGKYVKLGIISNNSAKLSGTVLGPNGIISNNSAKIISNNSAKYRVAYDAKGVEGAIVYLTSPNEEFYTDADGKVLYAITDANGHYRFDNAPGGVPLIVSVVGSQDRRLVGFRKTLNDGKKSVQAIDVSLATTYATELLRGQAKDVGKEMGDFFDETKFNAIVGLTNQLIESGKLGVIDVAKGLPDLTIRNIPTLRNDYLMAFATGTDELSTNLKNAWQDLLGQKFVIVTSIDTKLGTGHTGISVTTDPDGNLYYSAVNDTMPVLLRIKPDGTTFDFFAGNLDGSYYFENRKYLYGSQAGWGINFPTGLFFKGGELYFCDLNNGYVGKIPSPLTQDEYVTPPDWSSDELPESFYNSNFSEVVPDPLADFTWEEAPYPWLNFKKVCNLRSHFNLEGDINPASGLPSFASADVLVTDNGIFVADSKKNVILKYNSDGTFASTIAGKAGQRGFSGDGGPATDAVLNGPYSLTQHANQLYFADISNHRIRKVDLGTGIITTVAGNSDPNKPEGQVLIGGFSGDGGPATSALLNYPHDVAIAADGTLYISDSDNQRIRKVSNGVITTVAGMDPRDQNAIRGDGQARWIALGEIHGIALDHDGNLLMADSRSGALRKLWLK